MAPKKILVIEDVHYLRNDVLEMLRFEGYDVEGAENGLIGVQTARSYHPDLIICDIMMPGLNGFEVLKELRNDAATRAIPFIFLTAKTDRLDMREGMGLGADDYITKPFYSEELLRTIRARLDRRDYYNQQAEQKVQQIRENISTALPHELRTPLNTIIGFSDMLILEAPNLKPDQVMEWSQHINNAALRLFRLVENYLTYVRVENIPRNSALHDAMRQKVTDDPATAIEYQAIHRAQLVKREADLKLEIGELAPVLVAQEDLTKIIDELVDNAFKFSAPGSGEKVPAGTPFKPVTVRASTADGYLIITISDEGRGMAPEHIANIGAYMQFERFFYEQQGSGLGLVISKRLAELYDGTLTIDSVKDQYTHVHVRLPLKLLA